MMAIMVVQGVVLIVLCILVAGLLRAYGSVLRRLHELDGGERSSDPTPSFRTIPGVPEPRSGSAVPGRPDETWPPAHDISGADPIGDVVAARVKGTRHDTVLIFLSTGCTACQRFWEQLATYRSVPGTRLLVITKSADQESPALVRELTSPGVDVIMSTDAWLDYRVPGSPYVVVVNGGTGRVSGEGSGSSLDQLVELMRVAGADARTNPDGSTRLRKPRADRERETDVDQLLLASGIGPGHPSLYAEPSPDPGPRPAPGRTLDLVPPDVTGPERLR